MCRFFKKILNSKNKKNDVIERQYTIDEYLDLIGKYTDEMILSEKEKVHFYTGGDCVFSEFDDKRVKINIRMFFIDVNESRTVVESERILRKDNFDKDSVNRILAGDAQFEVNMPGKEEQE